MKHLRADFYQFSVIIFICICGLGARICFYKVLKSLSKILSQSLFVFVGWELGPVFTKF